MARTINRLSAAGVQKASKPGFHPDGAGLYLRIGPTGGKSWIWRYRANGGRHDMGLGSYPTVGLAEARERAAIQRRLRLDGRNPLADRRAAREAAKVEAAKAMTFRQCAEAYIETHRAGWKNPVHAKQWPSTLGNYVYPVMGELPVAAVDTGLVMRALEPIWTAKPETAVRVRGRIEAVLDWARARGYRSGENPARWKGHLDNLLPARAKVRRVEHHAALPYAELPAFMAELTAHRGMAARALRFLILTAARTGEAIGATWREFDLKECLWTMPAERMKAGKEHRVPLSEAALAVLGQPGQPDDRVFPLSNMAMLELLKELRPGVTTHGFRSTFSDWCAERTNFPAEVREMALAHAVGDKVEAAYRRGDLFDKRRQLAEAWAGFCMSPAAAEGSKVVATG